MIQPTDQESFGYAVAPAAVVDSQGIPYGRSFQYDSEFKMRQPEYPYDQVDNPSGYIDPIEEYLDGTPIVVDFKPHYWSVMVSEHEAIAAIDGHPLRPIELISRKEDACAGGVYIRVWNGTIIAGLATIVKI
jgi:hypothetical protein